MTAVFASDSLENIEKNSKQTILIIAAMLLKLTRIAQVPFTTALQEELSIADAFCKIVLALLHHLEILINGVLSNNTKQGNLVYNKFKFRNNLVTNRKN